MTDATPARLDGLRDSLARLFASRYGAAYATGVIGAELARALVRSIAFELLEKLESLRTALPFADVTASATSVADDVTSPASGCRAPEHDVAVGDARRYTLIAHRPHRDGGFDLLEDLSRSRVAGALASYAVAGPDEGSWEVRVFLASCEVDVLDFAAEVAPLVARLRAELDAEEVALRAEDVRK